MSHHHHHHCHHDHEECCELDDHSHSGCSEEHEHSEDFAHQLLEMADLAWMEVLKEKIKEQILATNGKHLDKLAKLVSDANNERWKHKMANKKVSSDYREKITNFFNQK